LIIEWLSTNATLVCNYSDIKSALYTLFGYIYLGDGDTDRREILHDGIIAARQKVSPFAGGAPSDFQMQILGLNFGHLTANISNSVSRNVTCQLEFNFISK